MVACRVPYDFVNMSPLERHRVLTSGPSRFQRLSAFHPSITSRYSENLGTTLPSTYPKVLFNILCNLEVFLAHVNNFVPLNVDLLPMLRNMLKFCTSLSKIYQVIFRLFFHFSQMSILSIFCPFCHLSPKHPTTKDVFFT